MALALKNLVVGVVTAVGLAMGIQSTEPVASQMPLNPQPVYITVRPESIKDIAIRISREYGATTTAITMAIVEKESNFTNICNIEYGCISGIGPGQIVQSTFDENCTGDINNVEDNLRCTFELVDDGQYQRWRQSMDRWLLLLPDPIKWMVKERCECFSAVRLWGFQTEETTVKDIRPNSPPAVGAAALFNYDGIYHIALIIKIEPDGFTVRESNYNACHIDTRKIDWADPNLIGFHK